jgi:predicted Mrr-cat superfamily restriction endonuclease
VTTRRLFLKNSNGLTGKNGEEGALKYWLMHAGNYEEAIKVFLDEGVIAMDWLIGDLSTLPTNEQMFKQRFREQYLQAHPDEAETGSIGHIAGTNYRFIHLAHIGDYILFTPKADKDRSLYLGQIEGAYYYNPTPDPKLPEFKHQRKVKWLARYLRADLSEAIVHPLGTMSEIDQSHHQEIRAKFTNKF